MTREQRRFTRVQLKISAEIAVDEKTFRFSEFQDLGVGGCLLQKPSAEFVPGDEVKIKIMMSGASSELSIYADATVLRSDSKGVALKFIRIDPDSLFHLQNIVRYNASDPDGVEREILDHPGLR